MKFSVSIVLVLITINFGHSLSGEQHISNNERIFPTNELVKNIGDDICVAPYKSPTLIKVGPNFIDLQFVYGRDTAKIVEMSQHCVMFLEIRKDSEIPTEVPTRDANGTIESFDFNNLTTDTSVDITWAIVFENKNTSMNYSSSWQIQTIKTLIEQNSSLAIEETREEGKLVFSWDFQRKFSNYYYQIEWIPLQCSKASPLWANGTDWKLTTENFLEISEKDFPFNEITLHVNPVNTDLQILFGGKYTNTTRYIGVPENEILEVSCTQNECYYRLENNCYKQNGPQLLIQYSFVPVDQKYKKYEIKGVRPHDGKTQSSISIPEDILHFTEYNFSVTPANNNNISQPNLRKSTHFRSSASAPNKIEEMDVTSSHSSVTVNWKNPPSWPPTGELEKFKLVWTRIGFICHIIKCSAEKEFNITDLHPVNGYYSYEIQNLKTSTSYDIQVFDKNIGVDKWNSSVKVTVKTINGKPSPPSSFEVCNKSFSSITVEISPPNSLSTDLLYYNISASTEGLLPEVRNVSFLPDKNVSYEWDNLKEGEKYMLGVEACTKDMCSDCKITYSWTLPQPVFQDKIELVNEETTSRHITVNLQNETYHGNWSRFVIATKQNAAIPFLTSDIVILAEPDFPYYLDGVWIISLEKDFEGHYTLNLNGTGRSFQFASGMLIYTDKPFVCVSNFTRYFQTKDYNSIFPIVLGASLLAFIIMALILFCIRMRGINPPNSYSAING